MSFGLILSLISHASLLVHCGQDFEKIAQNIFVAHSEKFPSKEEFEKVLDDALQLLASGLLPLPGDVVEQISSGLNGVKNSLQQAA